MSLTDIYFVEVLQLMVLLWFWIDYKKKNQDGGDSSGNNK